MDWLAVAAIGTLLGGVAACLKVCHSIYIECRGQPSPVPPPVNGTSLPNNKRKVIFSFFLVLTIMGAVWTWSHVTSEYCDPVLLGLYKKSSPLAKTLGLEC